MRGAAGQHQGGADLVGGELIRQHPARQVVVGHRSAHPDLRHRGHHPGPFVIRLPVLGLEDFHTIETRQPGQLNAGQNARQLRTRRNAHQTLRNQLSNTHEQYATTRHRQKRDSRAQVPGNDLHELRVRRQRSLIPTLTGSPEPPKLRTPFRV